MCYVTLECLMALLKVNNLLFLIDRGTRGIFKFSSKRCCPIAPSDVTAEVSEPGLLYQIKISEAP